MFITVCALVLPINIELSRISKDFLKFSGDRTERVTPVPIPNTEVKPLRADGTARATAWETRSLPGLKRLRGAARLVGVFCFIPQQFCDKSRDRMISHCNSVVPKLRSNPSG